MGDAAPAVGGGPASRPTYPVLPTWGPARGIQRQLTLREREVLQALADGLSDKEIAQRLHLSSQTARNHMVNILGKLGVHSRLQALVLAVRDGIVTIR